MSSRDPAVYALAFYRCNKAGAATTADASCSLISAGNWAQLEPDNAIAWLYQASAVRGDERARDEAIFRASRAQASRLHWNSVGALTESRVMKQQPAETRGLLHSQAIGIHSAFALPDFRPVMSYCSPARTGDAARRQVCNDLAAVLTDRSTTVLELSMAWYRDAAHAERAAEQDTWAAYTHYMFTPGWMQAEKAVADKRYRDQLEIWKDCIAAVKVLYIHYQNLLLSADEPCECNPERVCQSCIAQMRLADEHYQPTVTQLLREG